MAIAIAIAAEIGDLTGIETVTVGGALVETVIVSGSLAVTVPGALTVVVAVAVIGTWADSRGRCLRTRSLRARVHA